MPSLIGRKSVIVIANQYKEKCGQIIIADTDEEQLSQRYLSGKDTKRVNQ